MQLPRRTLHIRVHGIGFLTAQFAHLCPDVLGNESLANRERRLRHACFAISLYGRALSLIHSSHREHQDSQDDGGQPQIPTNFPVNATRLLDVDRCSPTSGLIVPDETTHARRSRHELLTIERALTGPASNSNLTQTDGVS